MHRKEFLALAVFAVGCVIAVVVLTLEGDQVILAVLGGFLIGSGANALLKSFRVE